MLKRICSVALAALLLQAAAAPAFAKSSPEKEARRVEKVRAQLAKLGTGKDAVVRLELRDKTRLEGYVSEAGPESFVVTDKAGVATTVPYPQVGKAKGNNLSTGAKIGIGVGIGVGVFLLILWWDLAHDDS
ncbi:MAG TPA: hypothetical protein VGB98_01980 [Pyrinomonadaceae bacterium]|jgi:hypothetical protein